MKKVMKNFTVKEFTMKRLVVFVCMLAVLLGLTGVLVTRSQAGQEAKADAKSKEVKSMLTHSKARGEGAAVKTATDTNKKDAPQPLSVAKGGKARGAEGIIHVDSHIGYFCRVYDNGNYIGTVAPSGDLYYRAEAGTHILLGRVYFNDGSYWSAGPATASVGDGGTVVWHITN